MGLLYQILHQGYKLRNKAPKKPSRVARFFGAQPTPSYQGLHRSLDFLFPSTNESERTRSNYVVSTTTLGFLVKYLPGFLFFRLREVTPATPVARPVSFDAFRESYLALEDLDVNHCPLATTPLSQDWDTETQSIFRYLFVEKYFVSTYALVQLSAARQQSVSHQALLYAALINIDHFDFSVPLPTVHFINPSIPAEFIHVLSSSQESTVVRPYPSPITVEPFESHLTAANLAARQSALARLDPSSDDEYSSEDQDTPQPIAGAQSHPAFHRYTLAGHGLDHSLATPVRGLLNKLYNKGRTPRNKQIYRTGVFWCLWLTVLTIVGPFYVFYGFTFMYTHLYLFPLAILARLALVALARFFDLTARQLWLRFFYLF